MADIGHERQLCCACSETQETSKLTNVFGKEKVMNQQTKICFYGNADNFTGIRIFVTFSMWVIIFIFLSVSFFV